METNVKVDAKNLNAKFRETVAKFPEEAVYSKETGSIESRIVTEIIDQYTKRSEKNKGGSSIIVDTQGVATTLETDISMASTGPQEEQGQKLNQYKTTNSLGIKIPTGFDNKQ
jgi:hypothetical protein